MDLRYLYLALLFQVLLSMCGSGIYAAKDLREKRGDVSLSIMSGNSEFVKELEDKYSSVAAWRSSVKENPELYSQLAKEFENKYSNIAAWRSSNGENLELSEKLEDKHSSITGEKSYAEENIKLIKELDNKYLGLTGLK